MSHVLARIVNAGRPRARVIGGLLLVVLALACRPLSAEVLVPGTGKKVIKVGDDMEDPKWTYIYNLPKSSEENDKQQRLPGGQSKNARWFEGVMRGQPDVIVRVPPPEGGLEGSQGALLMRSNRTGVPGHHSGTMQQDDLIVNVTARLGGGISPSRSPSVVVRVHMPEWKEWERRRGPSFGFRAACQTHRMKKNTNSRWGGSSFQQDTYWPGIWVHFAPGDGVKTQDSAFLTIRANGYGGDIRGPKITEPGWWTFGMSFPPDGRVLYFAHPGVEPLTAADLISTQNPYGASCERLDTMFFDVVSGDNGSWSTPWIIDDPELYFGR